MSPGSTHFIDGAQIAADLTPDDGLALLDNEIDGIRSTGDGHLVFAGRGGVLGSIDIAGVLGDGADGTDITRLWLSSLKAGVDSTVVLDDLTPLGVAISTPQVPALSPPTLALLVALLLATALDPRRFPSPSRPTRPQ